MMSSACRGQLEDKDKERKRRRKKQRADATKGADIRRFARRHAEVVAEAKEKEAKEARHGALRPGFNSTRRPDQ